DWSVGVYATFPLFSGGQKTATHRRTVEDLAGLRIERRAMVERIEQRILDAINLTRASYPSIQLTQDGADAAQKNLKLITDYYARGIKSIIDLLDAQNLALVSDQRAANAVYDFLIDLMRIQRAVGKFDLFLSAEDRQAWIHKMEDYFKKEGVDPGTR
ncbi:MAG: TolC family protein, partial [Deltaproteobacteria bacterium]|nr:TolC family protein [Deltaproteobacteria bacterium]